MNIKSYCISLKDNIEERERCQKIYDDCKLNVEFNIVEKSLKGGIYGCFESHIKTLKKGIKYFRGEEKNNYIFIMEDDVYFDTNNLFDTTFILSLKNNVNWCYTLGYLTGFPSYRVNNNIIKLYNCQCMHAYLVPLHTAKKLSKLKWCGNAIDYDWIKVIDIFYAPRVMIAFQKDHISSTSSTNLARYIINKFGYKNVASVSEQWSKNCCLFYVILIILIFILIIYICIKYKIIYY